MAIPFSEEKEAALKALYCVNCGGSGEIDFRRCKDCDGHGWCHDEALFEAWQAIIRRSHRPEAMKDELVWRCVKCGLIYYRYNPAKGYWDEQPGANDECK